MNDVRYDEPPPSKAGQAVDKALAALQEFFGDEPTELVTCAVVVRTMGGTPNTTVGGLVESPEELIQLLLVAAEESAGAAGYMLVPRRSDQ